MKLLDNNTLIKKFYEKIAKDYPNYSFEDIKNISHYPFLHLKNIMEEGNLENFRLKYLGNFYVKEKRAFSMLENLEKNLNSGKIDVNKYEKVKSILEKFSNNEK